MEATFCIFQQGVYSAMLKTIKIKWTWVDLCEMVQSECQISAKEMIRSKEIHDGCAVELKNGAHPTSVLGHNNIYLFITICKCGNSVDQGERI